MTERERLTAGDARPEDRTLDSTLRPATLKDFVGQENLRTNLQIFLTAAKQRKEAIEHVLLHGAPGLGKTTLAYVIARELGVNIRVTSGPAVERAGDLGAILTNLEDGDILFIDEIHRLNRLVEETLYPAMEEYRLDIILGKGPAAHTVRLDLPRFSIIGATTRMSLLTSPLRSRFGATFHLGYYEDGEIEAILKRNARLLRIAIEPDALAALARRSRKTPRIANRLLKRVRDYVQVKKRGVVTASLVHEALKLFDIDERGLDANDRRILTTIIEKFKGGPVGITTLAAATNEEAETIEVVYEPFLLQLGLIERTARGRTVTDDGYKHLGMTVPVRQQPLIR